MVKKKVICFDIDGTLIDGNSWLSITEGLGCSVIRHVQLYEDVVSGKVAFDKAERELVDMWRQSGKATREKLTDIYKKIKIRDGVEDIFDFLRKKGFLIYLVSGSNKFFVEGIAKKLKPDGYYSNGEITFDDKGLILSINQNIYKQGETKVDQVTEIAQKNAVDISSIYFVGDGENDIDVFIATRRGLSIHTSDEYLKKVAYKNLESLDEIKLLFS